MEDITPSLLKKIQDDFDKNIKKNTKVKRIVNKIRDGTATYKDVNDYSIEVGETLANSFKKNLSSSSLPDGKMYYNIANRIINSTLKNNYDLISDKALKVQQTLNKKAKIGLKAIKAELNQDRIDGIINRISSENYYDDIAWILDEPTVNFSQSIVDDTIKVNSEFHGKSGMTPKIVRRIAGGCCKWCLEVAGTYTYPDVPKDVYRRHERCRCTVEYDPGDGKRQNVHSRMWRDKTDSDIIKERKLLEANNEKKEKIKKILRIPSSKQISIPAQKIDTSNLSFDRKHIKERGHNVTKEQAVKWIEDAKISIVVWNGKHTRYISTSGAAYVNNERQEIRTAFSKSEYDERMKKIMEVLKNE